MLLLLGNSFIFWRNIMRAWMEINKENLKYNVLKLKELAKNREVLGVVKANAYGMGAVDVAKTLQEIGVVFLELLI